MARTSVRSPSGPMSGSGIVNRGLAPEIVREFVVWFRHERLIGTYSIPVTGLYDHDHQPFTLWPQMMNWSPSSRATRSMLM